MLLGVVLMGAAPPVRAQFAVIDVASLAQLIGQARTLLQQLNAARAQIVQAQTLYQSMTGTRGMQQLVNTATFNYLPFNWGLLSAAEQGGGGAYANLAAAIGNAELGNTVLSPAQFAAYRPTSSRASANSVRRWRCARGLLSKL